MDKKEEMINFLLGLKSLYMNSDKPNYARIINDCIKKIEEGDVYKEIIEKMKNEKYDVWVSLPGYFTNLPKFVKDVEREVIGK